MKSSSFLCGILIGATAAIWTSRRKTRMMSVMNSAGSFLKLATASGGNQSQGKHSPKTQASHSSSQSSSGAAPSAQVSPSPASASDAGHSKEYNLKQITDFIKGNTDVRREVEAILRETGSTIPGL